MGSSPPPRSSPPQRESPPNASAFSGDSGNQKSISRNSPEPEPRMPSIRMPTASTHSSSQHASSPSEVEEVTFQPGTTGISADWNSGLITRIEPGSQADRLGVKAGWAFF